MKRTGLLIPLLVLLWLAGTHLVSAHAHLLRSNPPANAQLRQAPAEIRLWFTEPAEPSFSRITLHGADGAVIQTPASEVDADDPYQMVLVLGSLPDGLYTVVWRVLSAADGHVTEGSFAFGINVAPVVEAAAFTEDTPIDGVFVRWFNVFSLSLAVGSIGFWLFVWQPAIIGEANATPTGTRHLRRVTWGGWLALGIAGLLLLLLQASLAAGTSLVTALSPGGLLEVVTQTQFGGLWLARMGLWLLMGGALFASARNHRWLWLAFTAGVLLLLVHSLFSHASVSQAIPAIAHNWLHLLASALWIGGLLAFMVVLAGLRHDAEPAQTAGRLTGHFSNYARAAVVTIAVTGLYMAWLQVGSLEALTDTNHGRALLTKSVLFAPLLALAGVNVLLTRRKLLAGERVWVGRLRALIGAEIVLAVSIVAAVGVMTSSSPARETFALRQALENTPPAAPLHIMENADDLHVHLEINPGIVGENTFNLSLFDVATGTLVTDVSLVRMRLESQEQSLGRSELRPELQTNNTFTVTGSNLSVPGEWQLRLTIQRPDRFDTLVDLYPIIETQRTPPPPIVDTSLPPLDHLLVMTIASTALVIIGAFFLFVSPPSLQNGATILASITLVVGLLSLGLAVLMVNDIPTWEEIRVLRVRDAWARPAGQGMTGAAYLMFENETDILLHLISARTDIAGRIELHTTEYEGEIMRMRALSGLEIPPGSTVRLAPGGDHLMLLDLQHDLIPGDTFTLTLTFASGEQMLVNVQVREDD